ncbi:MAG: hypothetical protein MJ252_09220, partial [archaeon]|nr:hypothetical protein [archaeon]
MLAKSSYDDLINDKIFQFYYRKNYDNSTDYSSFKNLPKENQINFLIKIFLLVSNPSLSYSAYNVNKDKSFSDSDKNTQKILKEKIGLIKEKEEQQFEQIKEKYKLPKTENYFNLNTFDMLNKEIIRNVTGSHKFIFNPRNSSENQIPRISEQLAIVDENSQLEDDQKTVIKKWRQSAFYYEQNDDLLDIDSKFKLLTYVPQDSINSSNRKDQNLSFTSKEDDEHLKDYNFSHLCTNRAVSYLSFNDNKKTMPLLRTEFKTTAYSKLDFTPKIQQKLKGAFKESSYIERFDLTSNAEAGVAFPIQKISTSKNDIIEKDYIFYIKSTTRNINHPVDKDFFCKHYKVLSKTKKTVNNVNKSKINQSNKEFLLGNNIKHNTRNKTMELFDNNDDFFRSEQSLYGYDTNRVFITSKPNNNSRNKNSKGKELILVNQSFTQENKEKYLYYNNDDLVERLFNCPEGQMISLTSNESMKVGQLVLETIRKESEYEEKLKENKREYDKI